MIEIIPCGNWPANSICDIKFAVSLLQKNGYVRTDFTAVASKDVTQILWTQVYNLSMTYLNYLEGSKIVNTLIISEDVPDNEMMVYATNNNFPFFTECNGIRVVRDDSVVRILHINDHSLADWNELNKKYLYAGKDDV